MKSLHRYKRLILLMLLFLLSSAILALLGLYQEKKISSIDDMREQIDIEKSTVQHYQQYFSNYYSLAMVNKRGSSDIYRKETEKVRDYNLCVKNWHIGRQSTLIPYFLKEYKSFSNQSFYNKDRFQGIEKLYNDFYKWNIEHQKKWKDACSDSDNAMYVLKASNEFINAYIFFLENLNLVATDLIKNDDKLLIESLEISNEASLFYFITFILLVLSTVVIILIDVMSNRGQNE